MNGGGFTILKECLEKIAKSEVFKSWKIIVLVHSEKNLSVYENIEYISFPLAKKNYIFRCFYEYIYFYVFFFKGSWHKEVIFLFYFFCPFFYGDFNQLLPFKDGNSSFFCIDLVYFLDEKKL